MIRKTSPGTIAVETKAAETVTGTEVDTVTLTITTATQATELTTAAVIIQPPLTPGTNLLQNSGFEELTASGPQGSTIDWQNAGGGRLCPNRFQAAAHTGQAYATVHYDGAQTNPMPIMTQTLNDLALDRPCTLTFYCDLHLLVQAVSCELVITLDSTTICTRTLTVANDPRPYNWKGQESTTPTILTSRTKQLSFTYSCITLGTQGNTYSAELGKANIRILFHPMYN
ncbi:hypothetical protein CERZMDRAFT_101377 [Cercospora zeae-maydis SCOH1-5]|uniref:Uncharacterized protein n=1 Tax=Cercospora zeae-maydis SCOH1-5 TaxID=717836 RepID=A0A6A6F7J0_9PEZI|nr:hypothetical protein CERZMDRAFT_101377 [Cercospora zeae-maydis SCOH1-5]